MQKRINRSIGALFGEDQISIRAENRNPLGAWTSCRQATLLHLQLTHLLVLVVRIFSPVGQARPDV